MEPEPLIESSFRRLLASLDAEREQLRGAWQRLSEERDLTTEHLEKLRQETEEWCYREKLKIDNEWQRLNQLSEEMTKMWPATVEILEINCSGEHFTIPRETICGIEGSVLSEMFSDEFLHEIPRDEEGRFFLDFNPQCFGMVVEYLRNRRLRADAPLPLVPQMQKRNMELLAEAWKLWPFLKTNRLNQLHGTSLHISTQLVDQKELHIIRATHPGWQAMLSVAGFEKEKLSGLCEEARKFEGAKGVCQIANELFPKGFSCAGTETAINKLKELADSGGALQAKVLKTSGGFHTSLMEPAKAKLAQALDDMLPRMQPLKHSVYMNTTGEALKPGTEPKAVVELLKKQLTSPVLWEPSMQKMISSGITDFYECGPNKQIKAMMKRINPKAWGATTNVEV